MEFHAATHESQNKIKLTSNINTLVEVAITVNTKQVLKLGESDARHYILLTNKISIINA